MAWQFEYEHRVGFAETDMAGIVHFTNVFRMMESAEHAFFRSLGFSIVTEIEREHYGWPRVHASCDYFQPLKFEDVVTVVLMVRNMTERSIEYGFRLTCGERKIAQGMFKTVCVQRDEVSGGMRAVPIPLAVREAIEIAPAEMLDD